MDSPHVLFDVFLLYRVKTSNDFLRHTAQRRIWSLHVKVQQIG